VTVLKEYAKHFRGAPSDTGDFYAGGKAAGAWNWQLTPPTAEIKKAWNYVSNPPIRLHGVVLN